MDAFMSCEGEVHAETQLVTYNRHIQRNVGEAESKDRVCSQVLLSLNTEHQFTGFLSQYGLIMTIGEISMRQLSAVPVRPTPCVAGSGTVLEAPRAPWIWFCLLRYNEGAGAWLLRGRVAALQP